MNQPLYRKIGIASIILTASVISSRILGFVRDMIIAAMAGAGASVDAYQAAFSVPEILNHIAATGFLSITFIPIFSKCLKEGKTEEGQEFFNLILNVFGIFLLILTLPCMIFAESLVHLLTPGLTDPLTFSNAVYMTRIVMPAQLFFFAGGLFTAVQYTKGHFLIPALMPLLYNIFIILGGIVLYPRLGMLGFAWGVLIGAFLGAFVLQAIGAYRHGIRYRFVFSLRHPVIWRYLKLSLPLMLALTMTFSSEIFIRFFGSLQGQGGMATLNFALRLALLFSAVFGQTIGTAAYPFMAQLAIENKFDELNKLLRDILRLLCMIIPLAAWVVLLRVEIVRIAYERGAFTSVDTFHVASILGFMIFGAFAFSAQNIVSRGFYAKENTWLPALLSTIMVLLSIPVYGALGKVMGAPGIALAMVISSTIQVFVLYSYWCHKTNYSAAPVYWLMIKAMILSAVLIFFIPPIQKGLLSGMGEGPWGLYKIGVVSVFFLIFLIVGAKILQIHEINLIFSRLIKRLKRAYSST